MAGKRHWAGPMRRWWHCWSSTPQPMSKPLVCWLNSGCLVARQRLFGGWKAALGGPARGMAARGFHAAAGEGGVVCWCC